VWSAKLRGKKAVLGQLFIQKNHPVTKTGSGQTQETPTYEKQTPFARRLSSLTSPLTGAEYVNQSGGVNPLYDPTLISPKTSTVSAFPGDVRLSQACLGKWLRFVAWDHSKSD
jgi:hypothetical protein